MFGFKKIKEATSNQAKQAGQVANASQSALPPTKENKGQVMEKDKALLEAEKVFREGVVSVRDVIAPAAFKVDSNFLRLNDVYVRTLFVMTYPRYVTIGWFAPIINESLTLDIAMFFYPLDIQLVLKQLRNKVGTMEAQIISDHEKGAPRDPIAETALRDIEGLRDGLSQGTEKFFQFSLYVTIYSKDKDE